MAVKGSVSVRGVEGTPMFVLILHAVAGVAAFLLSRWSASAAAQSEAWHLLAGVLVWLAVLMHQRLKTRAAEEALDAEAMDQSPQGELPGGSLFDSEPPDALTAQGRLNQFEKVFLPAFSVGIVLVLGYVSASLLRMLTARPGAQPVTQPLMTGVVFIGFAFVTFLIAKYTRGLASEARCRPLRPGANFTMSNALCCLLVGVSLLCVHFELTIVERIVAYAIAALMGVLAIEIVLNLVLALYRPRHPDQERRAAYDSRLLGMLTTSGGVLKAAAETLDYQFGFKVSETWFYRFMERAIAPLILFQIATFYLLTCFVVIDSHEEAVIEFLGAPRAGRATVGPGLHLKWPWPIEITRRYPVSRIEMLQIGEQLKEEVSGYLWTVSHAERPYHLLAAGREEPGTEVAGDSEAVPVSLLSGSVSVYFRVTDLYDFLYNYSDPKATFSKVCHRELARYAASSDFLELLGSRRNEATAELKRRFQSRARSLGLGIYVLDAALQGIHPPYEVAGAFEDVVASMEDKEAEILKAHAYENDLLPAAEAEAERLRLAAEAYKKHRVLVSRAEAQRFQGQLAAYNRAPDVFRARELHSAMEEAFADSRKIILADWMESDEVMILDLEDKMLPGFELDLE